MDSVVQRLHRALAEAIERRRPDIEVAPVTVAEIYQELVPYRLVRGTVGFEMNADYEHALLRLLAGESGLVRLEPDEVRATLERELTTPNPDVTLFRRFAACDVWVTAPARSEPQPGSAEEEPADLAGIGDDWTPEWLEQAARELEEPAAVRPWMTPDEEQQAPSAPPESPGAEAEPGRAAFAAADEPVGGERPRPEEPVRASGDAEPAPVGAMGSDAERRVEREMPAAAERKTELQCAFCRGTLPTDRPVRFCPFCGVDQQLRPCSRCGEVLEPGWRYCVSCGAPAPAAGA